MEVLVFGDAVAEVFLGRGCSLLRLTSGGECKLGPATLCIVLVVLIELLLHLLPVVLVQVALVLLPDDLFQLRSDVHLLQRDLLLPLLHLARVDEQIKLLELSQRVFVLLQFFDIFAEEDWLEVLFRHFKFFAVLEERVLLLEAVPLHRYVRVPSQRGHRVLLNLRATVVFLLFSCTASALVRGERSLLAKVLLDELIDGREEEIFVLDQGSPTPLFRLLLEFSVSANRFTWLLGRLLGLLGPASVFLTVQGHHFSVDAAFERAHRLSLQTQR